MESIPPIKNMIKQERKKKEQQKQKNPTKQKTKSNPRNLSLQ